MVSGRGGTRSAGHGYTPQPTGGPAASLVPDENMHAPWDLIPARNDLPVCTSQILICPSLSPVARIRQEMSGTWGWWRAQSFLLGGEGHGLKAKPQTICPQSRVFSFGLPRPFVSFLLLRLLASNPLGMLEKAEIP